MLEIKFKQLLNLNFRNYYKLPTALSFKNHIIAYLPLPDSFQVGEISIYCMSVLYF